jgi:hypothetical protein
VCYFNSRTPRGARLRNVVILQSLHQYIGGLEFFFNSN